MMGSSMVSARLVEVHRNKQTESIGGASRFLLHPDRASPSRAMARSRSRAGSTV